MNNLSERVQREFSEWQEKYEIPVHMEFEVKTLLKLQEEYDETPSGSNTTRTRETLLGMITKLHRDMRFSEKVKIIKPIYVDCIRLNGISGMTKVIIYHNGNITIIENRSYSYKDYAIALSSFIDGKDKTSRENIVIYVDTRGLGMGLYDELVQLNNLAFVVKQLEYKQYNH